MTKPTLIIGSGTLGLSALVEKLLEDKGMGHFSVVSEPKDIEQYLRWPPEPHMFDLQAHHYAKQVNHPIIIPPEKPQLYMPQTRFVQSQKERRIKQPLKITPSTALNAPCPCGSGKKFKRCCKLK